MNAVRWYARRHGWHNPRTQSRPSGSRLDMVPSMCVTACATSMQGRANGDTPTHRLVLHLRTRGRAHLGPSARSHRRQRTRRSPRPSVRRKDAGAEVVASHEAYTATEGPHAAPRFRGAAPAQLEGCARRRAIDSLQAYMSPLGRRRQDAKTQELGRCAPTCGPGRGPPVRRAPVPVVRQAPCRCATAQDVPGPPRSPAAAARAKPPRLPACFSPALLARGVRAQGPSVTSPW